MTVFSDLCMRARKRGAKRLDFTAQLHDESTPEGICGEWSCLAWESPTVGRCLASATGRTGEEALREVVRMLERSR